MDSDISYTCPTSNHLLSFLPIIANCHLIFVTFDINISTFLHYLDAKAMACLKILCFIEFSLFGHAHNAVGVKTSETAVTVTRLVVKEINF